MASSDHFGWIFCTFLQNRRCKVPMRTEGYHSGWELRVSSGYLAANRVVTVRGLLHLDTASVDYP
jgi:hypothetical protein